MAAPQVSDIARSDIRGRATYTQTVSFPYQVNNGTSTVLEYASRFYNHLASLGDSTLTGTGTRMAAALLVYYRQTRTACSRLPRPPSSSRQFPEDLRTMLWPAMVTPAGGPTAGTSKKSLPKERRPGRASRASRANRANRASRASRASQASRSRLLGW
jgi:hypothetical protein